MKLFVAATFALLAVASADVSHLSRTYLPPSISSYSSGGDYSSVGGYSNGGGYSGGAGFSGGSGFSGGAGYSGGAGFSGGSGFSGGDGFSGGAGFSGGDGFSGGAGFSGGSGLSYSGGSSYSGPTSSYLPPVHASFSGPSYSAPAFQSAHGIESYSGHSGGFSSGGADIGTQYAANGGYVYKKK